VGVQGQHRAALLPGQLQTSGHSPTSNQDGRPAAMTTDLHVPPDRHASSIEPPVALATQISYTCELLGQSPVTLCKALGRIRSRIGTAVPTALCCPELEQRPVLALRVPGCHEQISGDPDLTPSTATPPDWRSTNEKRPVALTGSGPGTQRSRAAASSTSRLSHPVPSRLTAGPRQGPAVLHDLLQCPVRERPSP
jgi:hypothetical protein